jgi:hypothetical protein
MVSGVNSCIDTSLDPLFLPIHGFGYPWLFSLDWLSAYRAAGATANPEAIDLGGNRALRQSKFSSGDILIGLVAANAERVGLRGGRGSAE